MTLRKTLWGLPCEDVAEYTAYLSARKACQWQRSCGELNDKCKRCEDSAPRQFLMVEPKRRKK